MRIDKFLKVSRIIKRRSVASDACDLSKVFVNGKAAKPAHKLKIGDEVKIEFGNTTLLFTVKCLDERSTKEDAGKYYEIHE